MSKINKTFNCNETLMASDLNDIINAINGNDTAILDLNRRIDNWDGNIPEVSDGKPGISTILAFTGAENDLEAYNKWWEIKNNPIAPPSNDFSLSSNVGLEDEQSLYMISARVQGDEWLSTDGTIWSLPVRIGSSNKTSETGVDDEKYNYIYCRTLTGNTPLGESNCIEILNWIESDSNKNNGYKSNGTVVDITTASKNQINGAWTDHPWGISEELPYEWQIGFKRNDDNDWAWYYGPIIISKWGENGLDGDGVEYIFKVNSSKNIDLNPPYVGRIGQNGTTTYSNINVDSWQYQEDDFIPQGWNDEPEEPDNTSPYQFVSIRKKSKSENDDDKKKYWQAFSEPKIFNVYQNPGYELMFDNDTIIFDDNSGSETILAASRTNFSIWKGLTNVTSLFSNLEISFTNDGLEGIAPLLTNECSWGINYAITNYQFSLTKVGGNEALSQRNGGNIVKVSGTIDGVNMTLSRRLKVQIIDINTDGSAYSLTVSPNSLGISRTDTSSNVYNFRTGVNKTLTAIATKIRNGEIIQEPIYLRRNALDGQLFISVSGPNNCTNSILEDNSALITIHDTSVDISTVPNYEVRLFCKKGNSGILVDAETVDFAIKGDDGKDGEGTGFSGVLKFKSRVFCRTYTNIGTEYYIPTGGTYDSPWPDPVTLKGITWSDGIPNTEGNIWSSVRTFYSDNTETTWSIPAKESDSERLDIEFSLDETYTDLNIYGNRIPFQDNSDIGWYDPDLHKNNLPSGKTWNDMIWRAERQVKNGLFVGNWVISRIKGERGDSPGTAVKGDFKSRAFCRTNSDISNITPTGGNYDDPKPTSNTYPSGYSGETITWSDGVPSGNTDKAIWSTTRIFKGSEVETSWSSPVKELDTESLDIEFSDWQGSKPEVSSLRSTPKVNHPHSGNYNYPQWHDPSDASVTNWDEMIWRAERLIVNGQYIGNWVISRIKGEKGDSVATSVYEVEFSNDGAFFDDLSLQVDIDNASINTIRVKKGGNYIPFKISSISYQLPNGLSVISADSYSMDASLNSHTLKLNIASGVTSLNSGNFYYDITLIDPNSDNYIICTDKRFSIKISETLSDDGSINRLCINNKFLHYYYLGNSITRYNTESPQIQVINTRDGVQEFKVNSSSLNNGDLYVNINDLQGRWLANNTYEIQNVSYSDSPYIITLYKKINGTLVLQDASEEIVCFKDGKDGVDAAAASSGYGITVENLNSMLDDLTIDAGVLRQATEASITVLKGTLNLTSDSELHFNIIESNLPKSTTGSNILKVHDVEEVSDGAKHYYLEPINTISSGTKLKPSSNDATYYYKVKITHSETIIGYVKFNIYVDANISNDGSIYKLSLQNPELWFNSDEQLLNLLRNFPLFNVYKISSNGLEKQSVTISDTINSNPELLYVHTDTDICDNFSEIELDYTLEESNGSIPYSQYGYDLTLYKGNQFLDGPEHITCHKEIEIPEIPEEHGNTRRFFYYDGEWVRGKVYCATKTEAPYVKYNDELYILNPEEEYFCIEDLDTLDAPDIVNSSWTKMNSSSKFYIAEAYFGNYAHFGAAIINLDYLMSQYGYMRGFGDSRVEITNSNNNYYTKINTNDIAGIYPFDGDDSDKIINESIHTNNINNYSKTFNLESNTYYALLVTGYCDSNKSITYSIKKGYNEICNGTLSGYINDEYYFESNKVFLCDSEGNYTITFSIPSDAIGEIADILIYKAKFVPYLTIDLKTGKLIANNIIARGKLFADSFYYNFIQKGSVNIVLDNCSIIGVSGDDTVIKLNNPEDELGKIVEIYSSATSFYITYNNINNGDRILSITNDTTYMPYVSDKFKFLASYLKLISNGQLWIILKSESTLTENGRSVLINNIP